jgi:hypothetical protein
MLLRTHPVCQHHTPKNENTNNSAAASSMVLHGSA